MVAPSDSATAVGPRNANGLVPSTDSDSNTRLDPDSADQAVAETSEGAAPTRHSTPGADADADADATLDEALQSTSADSDATPGDSGEVGSPKETAGPRWMRYLRWLTNWSVERTVTAFIVAASSGLLFWALSPDLIFTNTTPSGGDMGAHVWGPQFLRDNLLSKGRLSGWTPDWYAGFPAYHFYMVIPSVLILVADIFLPYGIAFKIVTVSGIVSLPISAWAFGRLARLPFPGPAFCALATLPFLLDRSYSIWGANIASTMAGEFAYSMGLSIALLYLGVVVRGLRNGRHRGLAAVLLALCGLTHIIPAFFAIGVSAILLAFHFRVANLIRWALPVSLVSGLLSAFWVLPFFARQDYLNDMGWERTDQYFTWLVPNTDMQWLQMFAVIGLMLSIATRRRIGIVLAVAVLGIGVAFMVLPQARLWNARILPFYYLSTALLGAIGASLLFRVVAGGGSVLFDAEGRSRSWRRVILAASPLLFGWAIGVDNVLLGSWFAERLVGLTAIIIEGPIGSLFGSSTKIPVANRPGLAQQLSTVGNRIAVAGVMLTIAEFVRLLILVLRVSGPRVAPLRSLRIGTTIVGATVVLFIAWLPLNLHFDIWGLRGGTENFERTLIAENDPEIETDNEYNDRSWNQALGLSASPHFVDGWAKWNYSGYEEKDSYPEYYAVVQMMEQVGEEQGCGRAMWEYESELNRFGTPMALMLLPHWTDGCIGSMEGLYFEASATTPYHFINQTELSSAPSQAQRNLPYGEFDIVAGVRHLQQMGVRYYMAFSDQARAESATHPDLTLVNSVGDWQVYQVAESALVEPLPGLPVVLEGISDHNEEWLAPALASYLDEDGWTSPLASHGPSDWPRANVDDVIRYSPEFDRTLLETDPEVAMRDIEGLNLDAVEFRSVPDSQALNIETDTDSISFEVTEIGVPMLVKASYFPNWKVSGADGPYRVAPNFMVVVPTETEVRLSYGWTPFDIGGYLLTILGIGALIAFTRMRPLGEMKNAGIGEYDPPTVLRPGVDPDRADIDGEVLGIVDSGREPTPPPLGHQAMIGAPLWSTRSESDSESDSDSDLDPGSFAPVTSEPPDGEFPVFGADWSEQSEQAVANVQSESTVAKVEPEQAELAGGDEQAEQAEPSWSVKPASAPFHVANRLTLDDAGPVLVPDDGGAGDDAGALRGPALFEEKAEASVDESTAERDEGDLSPP